MNEMTPAVPTETSSYETTRFNALRHGLLSRYTVLPWEDEDEYRVLVDALVMEHAPSGPTEEHLVEELAGILWRKRRPRMAEGSVYHHGLRRALEPYSHVTEAALAHLRPMARSNSANTPQSWNMARPIPVGFRRFCL